MQDGADLRYLLAEGRGSRIDWLPDAVQPARLAVSLAALANGQGGQLIVGVDPTTNRVEGVQSPAAAAERLLLAAGRLDPALILPLPRSLVLDDRRLVLAQVPPGLPYLYSVDGRYFVRDGPHNGPLTASGLRRKLLERGDPGPESDCPAGAEASDLDPRAVQAYLASLPVRLGADPAQSLRRRGCLVEHDGRPRPTLAGLLLFGARPERRVPQAVVRLTRHAGRMPGGQVVRETIGGRLPDQIRATTLSLTSMLSQSHEGRTGWGWPVWTLRELVMNAVAHRDYASQDQVTQIDVFSDRLEVVSPGSLAGPLTVELLGRRRFVRNPVICQILNDMGLLPGSGGSIGALLATAAEMSARAPVFEESAEGLRVTLYSGAVRAGAPARPARHRLQRGGDETGVPSYSGAPVSAAREADGRPAGAGQEGAGSG